MLPADMDAPVAANGHAAEIDILRLGFLPSSHRARRVARTGTVYFKADDKRVSSAVRFVRFDSLKLTNSQ